MRKEFILPTITAIILILVLILTSVPETKDFFTGFAVSQPQQYSLTGQIRIITPYEISESCDILLSLQDQSSGKVIEKDIQAIYFKKLSQIEKDTTDNFVTYTAQLQDLTQDIIVEKSIYILSIKVFCNENLVSQTEQYLEI